MSRLPGWRCLGILLGGLTLVASGRAAASRPAPASLAGSPFVDEIAAVWSRPAGESDAGNDVAMLSGGYDALLVRLHLIRQARSSIDIQTFIWSNDEVGRLMIYELIEAAKRGVKVRIIADQMFSDQDPAIVAFVATAHPNLQLKHYRPTLSRIHPNLLHTLAAGARSFHDVNQRMHSKVMLFDGAVLITGGRNFENGYFDHAIGLNYRDRDVLVVGPAVAEAARTFERFWAYRHSVASRDLVDVADVIREGTFRRFPARSDYDFGPYFVDLIRQADDPGLIAGRFVRALRPVAKATFLSDDPGKSRGYFGRTARTTRELTRVLQRARSEVMMQTPYLVLSPAARELFAQLRRQHPALRVQVSTNSFSSTDNTIAYSANYRLRSRYVEDLQFEIHEFRPLPAALPELFPRYGEIAAYARTKAGAPPPFLCIHAKSLVVDDTIAFVGSFNLDPRSQNLNTEVGLLVEDAAFAHELRAEIETDLLPANSWVIGRRDLPLGFDAVNGLIGGVLSLSPIDVWPIQNTSSFELRPGGTVVSPFDPAFHRNYREVGPFPGTDGRVSTKEILTRLYKAVGTPLTPIL